MHLIYTRILTFFMTPQSASVRSNLRKSTDRRRGSEGLGETKITFQKIASIFHDTFHHYIQGWAEHTEANILDHRFQDT